MEAEMTRILLFAITFLLNLPSILLLNIQPADLLFVSPPLNATTPFSKAILTTGNATIEWMLDHSIAVPPSQRSNLADHVAFAINSTHLIEAYPVVGVHIISKQMFLERTQSAVLFLGKMDPQWESLFPHMIAAAQTVLGAPYANLFEPPSSGKFYCSSLITFALEKAGSGKERFIDFPFELIFEPEAYWRKYYAQQGERLPEGVYGSNPTLLLHSPVVRYTTH